MTLENGENILQKTTLEETALSIKDLQTLLGEASIGESLFAEKGSLEEYRKSLGIDKIINDTKESKDNQPTKKPFQKHPIKPGQRNPSRDAVGM